MLRGILSTCAALAFSVSAAGAQNLPEMNWDEIVAQAKEEGEVNWFVWYLEDDFRRAVAPFEQKYGIKVKVPDGTSDGNAAKLLAERERETGDIDVFSYGFNNFESLDLGSLFVPLNMLPEDSGRFYKVGGVDGGGYVVAFWGNQTGLAYDTTKLSEEDLPQTPDEIAAFWQANPGKFGFNYEKGGSGPSFYLSTLGMVSGVDMATAEPSEEALASLDPGYAFFNEHADRYVVTASNSDSIIRVSDGELWIAPGWEDHLAGLQNRGEVRKDIAFYIPKMGMSGGGNGIAIPKNAPHPAAAALLINWLASPETQTMFNDKFGTAPMNTAADDSKALISSEQRDRSLPWPSDELRKDVEARFVEDVILER